MILGQWTELYHLPKRCKIRGGGLLVRIKERAIFVKDDPPLVEPGGAKFAPPGSLKYLKIWQNAKFALKWSKFEEKNTGHFFCPLCTSKLSPLGKSPEDSPDGTDF